MPPIPTEHKDQIHQLSYLDRQNGGRLIGSESSTDLKASLNGHGKPFNDLSEIDNQDFIPKLEESFRPPSFTIKELRDCIPAHLFNRSLFKSSAYLALNLTIVGILFYLATFIDVLVHSTLLSYIVWPAWWWIQGVAMTGIWVIAHECGHQAFCDYKTINNAVGLILHSLLLVPYHPWRISHAQHHASTGHLAQDQVFVPKKRSQVRSEEPSPMMEAIESTPLYTIYNILSYLLVGWPAYLIMHVSGQQYPVHTSHFHPTSPIFEKRHRSQVIISDIALIAVVAGLTYFAHATSFLTMIKYYGIPYLWVNAWLVTITLLQHTDVYIPHYSPSSWNFVRGALTTVDRDYGWFLNTALHHIQDSHVAHHLFSQMPFYNAIQATPYLKAKLGQYYYYDQTPVYKALYRAVRNCVLIEDSGDIFFYHRK